MSASSKERETVNNEDILVCEQEEQTSSSYDKVGDIEQKSDEKDTVDSGNHGELRRRLKKSFKRSFSLSKAASKDKYRSSETKPGSRSRNVKFSASVKDEATLDWEASEDRRSRRLAVSDTGEESRETFRKSLKNYMIRKSLRQMSLM